MPIYYDEGWLDNDNDFLKNLCKNIENDKKKELTIANILKLEDIEYKFKIKSKKINYYKLDTGLLDFQDVVSQVNDGTFDNIDFFCERDGIFRTPGDKTNITKLEKINLTKLNKLYIVYPIRLVVDLDHTTTNDNKLKYLEKWYNNRIKINDIIFKKNYIIEGFVNFNLLKNDKDFHKNLISDNLEWIFPIETNGDNILNPVLTEEDIINKKIILNEYYLNAVKTQYKAHLVYLLKNSNDKIINEHLKNTFKSRLNQILKFYNIVNKNNYCLEIYYLFLDKIKLDGYYKIEGMTKYFDPKYLTSLKLAAKINQLPNSDENNNNSNNDKNSDVNKKKLIILNKWYNDEIRLLFDNKNYFTFSELLAQPYDIEEVNKSFFETCHNFIQWLFPSNEKSRYTSYNVILNFEHFNITEKVSENLPKALEVYKSFLIKMFEQNEYQNPDHNNSRISRVLICLRYFKLNDKVKEFSNFLNEIMKKYPDMFTSANYNAFENYWKPLME